MNRRWRAGMSFRTGDGLDWQVIPGRKRPSDLVLQVWTRSGWQHVKMETGFLLADFFGENEDVLRGEGYFSGTAEGSGYYLRHCRLAASEGWSAAATRLNTEREARRQRERPAPSPVEDEFDAIMEKVPWPKAAA